jgi:ATP-binding cassette subfamily B (MDR/TAP) protein 9
MGVTGAAAALGQALIPYYTGVIIDCASIDPDAKEFQWTCLKLVVVSLGCAVFTGIRGGLFTIGMTRLNVRIRTSLFDALMRQEIAFFSATRTGVPTVPTLVCTSRPALPESIFTESCQTSTTL